MPRRLMPEEVHTILTRGSFEDLLGAIEDEHFECKRAPYQLDEDRQKQELAKDVSGIANMSALTDAEGGHILLGVRTEKSPRHHGDVVADLSPYEQALVDPRTLHKVLEAWLVPVPDGIVIRWYPSATDTRKGVVAIMVPRQRAELWPFVVTKVVDDKSGKFAGNFVGYFERRRDNVAALSASEFQRLLRDGRRFDSVIEQMSIVTEELQTLRRQQEAQQTARQLPAKTSSALEQHRQRRGLAVEAAELNRAPVFALTAAPVQPVTLPALFRSRTDPLVQLLESPSELRVGGFDLYVGEPSRIVRGELRRAVVHGRMLLECWQDGALIFVAEASDFLCWDTTRGSRDPLRINPLALAESTYLFTELAREVYGFAEPRPESVEFSLTLYRINAGGQPCGLTPGGVRSREFSLGKNLKHAPQDTAEFIDRVDRQWMAGQAAYRLVRLLYTWFGFEEDAIPYVTEEDGKRLISPDHIRADGAPRS